jgi:hypothetical protein
MPSHTASLPLWSDTALIASLILALFAILFGTRHIDATEHHEGMILAIAFESVVKLIAFLAVGAFVTWGAFGGDWRARRQGRRGSRAAPSVRRRGRWHRLGDHDPARVARDPLPAPSVPRRGRRERR